MMRKKDKKIRRGKKEGKHLERKAENKDQCGWSRNPGVLPVPQRFPCSELFDTELKEDPRGMRVREVENSKPLVTQSPK